MVSKIKPRLAGAFFSLMILFNSCGNSPTVSPAEKEAFINTYVDLTLARIKHGNLKKQYNTTLASIYDQHGTNEQFLNEFLDRIESDYELQQEIFKAIAERLEEFEKIPSDSLNRYMKNLMVQP